MFGGCGDIHKSPAQCCCCVVFLGEREGSLCVTLSCGGKGSVHSLENLAFLENMDGVFEWASPGDSIVLLGGYSAHMGNDGGTWRGG